MSISMFFNLVLSAQCKLKIDTVSMYYFNGFIQKMQKIETYKMKNYTNEEYLTWISMSPIDHKTNSELIHDYFIKRKGDFNLIEMMNEGLLKDKAINIGYSFIKNILPNETFSYVILKSDSNTIFYQERIVLIKKKEVELYLNMQIKRSYFYPLKNIFLTVY